MTTSDLSTVVADASSVRATRAGALNPRNRKNAETLFVVFDVASLTFLRDALAIDRDSLAEKYALMTPGDLDLHFFRGHELLATVTYVAPSFVRWNGWPFDARLSDKERLAAWLTEHGWSSRA